jgi:hypothetical protein
MRRSKQPFSETFTRVGGRLILREDAISRSEIPGLSLNLFGGRFLEKHLCFRARIGRATESWDGEQRFFLSENLDFYEVKDSDSYCPIYFNIRDIHGKEVPYDRSKGGEINKLLSKIGDRPLEENEKYRLIGHTEIVHDPINSNYWHVQLNLTDHFGVEVHPKGQAWVKSLTNQTLTNILAVNALDTAGGDASPVYKRLYCKDPRPLC